MILLSSGIGIGIALSSLAVYIGKKYEVQIHTSLPSQTSTQAAVIIKKHIDPIDEIVNG